MAKPFDTLQHIIVHLANGTKILVLDTGATIPPEAEAMLQALHSRSVGGVTNHLEVLKEKGAEKFMSTFYVGYGHKSIGDCGSATVFIEGVSMLAAKAIQDWPLYSGQESSTRYIDFANQPFVDPLDTKTSKEILEAWRTFYLEGLIRMQEVLKERFPRGTEEKESTYDKAIAARSFDTMRGFLPAGAATNLAWHSNLRQFADKLLLLRTHPLLEVRNIACATEEALIQMFPSSFSNKRYENTDSYNTAYMQHNYYYNENKPKDFELVSDTIQRDLLRTYRDILKLRPPKTDLPKQLAECGELQFSFTLDFGSFRDLQRHRAITQRMPLLTCAHGFGPWYLDEMPQDLRTKAEELIRTQATRIEKLSLPPEEAQYYIAMGFLTTNRITGSLPALVYLTELRATRFVHPTLRRRAIQIAEVLRERFAPYGLVLHLDDEPDRFDVRRGEQDISVKTET